MKRALSAMMLAFVATGAVAQSSTTEGDTPAIATPNSKNPTAPVAGANSFTEAQATERLKDAGFSNITGLKLDGDGVWRGTGTNAGKELHFALDYQGNITTQ